MPCKRADPRLTVEAVCCCNRLANTVLRQQEIVLISV